MVTTVTRPVVVGVDGSDGAREALRVAQREARAHGVSLVVVLAWDFLDQPGDTPFDPDYTEAQAHFEEKAWFRAIYAGETPVGFVMLYDDPEKTDYFLWRFMIDQSYQGRHFGERALKLLIDHVRAEPGATELLVSYVPAAGSPEPFYRAAGFVDTGEISDGEVVMRLAL